MALVIILVIKKIIPTLGIFLPKNKTPPRNKVSTQRETQPATRTQQVPHLAEGWRDTGPHENAIFRGWLCRDGLFQMPTLWGIYYITRTHQCPPPPGPAQTLFAWVDSGPRANPVCVGGTWAGGVAPRATGGGDLSPEALAKDDLSPEALAKGDLSRVTSCE